MSGLGKNIFLNLSAVMIILVSVNILFFTVYTERYKEELHRVNKESVLQTKMVIDNYYVLPMFETYREIAFDLNGVGYNSLYNNGQNEAPSSWETYRIFKGLAGIYSKKPELLDSLSIYYKKHDLAISNIDISKEASISDEVRWITTLDVESKNYISDIEDDFITTVRTLPLNKSFDEAEALVGIIVGKDYLDNLLNAENMGQFFSFTMFTQNGDVIYSTVDEGAAQGLHTDLIDEIPLGRLSKNSVTQLESVDVVNAYVLSSDNAYIYGFSTPQNTFYQKALTLQRQFIGVIIALFLIGLVIVIIVNHRMYAPIKALVKQADDVLSSDDHIDGDDYEVIREMVDSLRYRISGLNVTMEKYMPTLMNNFYANLVQNTIEHNEISDKVISLGIRQRTYYRVVVIYIEEILFGSNLDLVQLGLMDYIDGFQTGSLDVFNLIRNNNRVVVVMAYDREQDCNQLITDTESYLRGSLTMPQSKIHYSVCVGGEKVTLGEVHRSYREAKKAYLYRILDKGILYYDIYEHKVMATYKELVDEIELSTILRTRSLKEMVAFIDGLIACFRERDICAVAIKRITDEMIHRSKHIISQRTLKGLDEVTVEFYDSYQRSRHLDDLYQCYEQLLLNLKELDIQLEGESNEELVQQILIYMEKHLEQDLSLSTLADEFHVSYSYLSKKIKESVGQTYSKFLLELRMSKARMLLKGSKKTVEMIASEIGFNDTGYFIKQFKKENGVTPGQYRKENILELHR